MRQRKAGTPECSQRQADVSCSASSQGGSLLMKTPSRDAAPRRLMKQKLADARCLDSSLVASASASQLSNSPQRAGVVAPKEGTAQQRVRRNSIDTGPEDWPTATDVGTEAPPIHNAKLSQLVEELADLELVVPAGPVDPTSPPRRPPPVRESSSHSAGACGTAPGEAHFSVSRVHLPNATELATFPEELAVHLRNVGQETLRTFLYPRVLLWLWRQQRARIAAERQPVPPSVAPEFIAKLALFRGWPADSITAIAKALHLRCYEPSEFVAFEKEPAGAIYFLVSGSVQLLTRTAPDRVAPEPGRKRYRKGNILSSQSVASPAAFGELSLLTDEPWSYAIRTSSKVDMWLLPKNKFARIINSVPSQIIAHSINVAFRRRNEAMRTNFPIDSEAVRAHGIFRKCTPEFLREVAERVEPHALPRNYTLARQNEPVQTLYFLRHGRVAVFRAVDGEEALVARLTPNAVIADVPLVHGSTSEFTCRTEMECDLYALPRATFLALTRQFPHDLDSMLDAARSQRQAELRSDEAGFQDLVRTIPLIRDVLPHYFVKEFVKLLHPRSICPLTSVCSTASFCDRIIILVKGRVRLGQSYLMSPGECIGWTCCVPHRWGANALSLDTSVEVLEIACQPLMYFLDQKGLLAETIHRSKIVMFPLAFSPSERQRIHSTLPRGLFPMYPVSRSPTVNLNEMGFCTVHMPLLVEVQREERERQRRILEETPPPFKNMSNGVYIPHARRIRGFTTSMR